MNDVKDQSLRLSFLIFLGFLLLAVWPYFWLGYQEVVGVWSWFGNPPGDPGWLRMAQVSGVVACALLLFYEEPRSGVVAACFLTALCVRTSDPVALTGGRLPWAVALLLLSRRYRDLRVQSSLLAVSAVIVDPVTVIGVLALGPSWVVGLGSLGWVVFLDRVGVQALELGWSGFIHGAERLLSSLPVVDWLFRFGASEFFAFLLSPGLLSFKSFVFWSFLTSAWLLILERIPLDLPAGWQKTSLRWILISVIASLFLWQTDSGSARVSFVMWVGLAWLASIGLRRLTHRLGQYGKMGTAIALGMLSTLHLGMSAATVEQLNSISSYPRRMMIGLAQSKLLQQLPQGSALLMDRSYSWGDQATLKSLLGLETRPDIELGLQMPWLATGLTEGRDFFYLHLLGKADLGMVVLAPIQEIRDQKFYTQSKVKILIFSTDLTREFRILAQDREGKWEAFNVNSVYPDSAAIPWQEITLPAREFDLSSLKLELHALGNGNTHE